VIGWSNVSPPVIGWSNVPPLRDSRNNIEDICALQNKKRFQLNQSRKLYRLLANNMNYSNAAVFLHLTAFFFTDSLRIHL
jgi:hypothetical protein